MSFLYHQCQWRPDREHDSCSQRQQQPRGELQLSFCELRNSNHSSSFHPQLHQQWKRLKFCLRQWGCPSLPAGLLLEGQQKVSIPMGEMCMDSVVTKWLPINKRPGKNKLRSSIGKWNGSPPHKNKVFKESNEMGRMLERKRKIVGRKQRNNKIEQETES